MDRFRVHAEDGRLPGLPVQLRGMQQGFRGDAPHIQTSATHLSTFEDNDLQSLLGSVFRSAITSWACAHYN